MLCSQKCSEWITKKHPRPRARCECSNSFEGWVKRVIKGSTSGWFAANAMQILPRLGRFLHKMTNSRCWCWYNNHGLNKKRDPRGKIWHTWPFGFIISLPQINKKCTALAWLVHRSHSCWNQVLCNLKSTLSPMPAPFSPTLPQRLHLLPESLASVPLPPFLCY